MKTIFSFGSVLLLSSLGPLACSQDPLDSSTSKTQGVLSANNFFAQEDFLLVKAEPKNKSDLDATMGFEDLGISKDEVTAMIKHGVQRFVLERGIQLGEGRAISNETPETQLSRFIFAECVTNPKNWKVATVRLAPYELGVIGNPKAYANLGPDWAEALHTIIQLRLTLRPICEVDPDNPAIPKPGSGLFRYDDQSFHVLYNFRTQDASLNAAIFDSLDQFKQLQLDKNPNIDAAHDALLTHKNALSSQSYKNFRAGVLNDFVKVSSARRTNAARGSSTLRGILDTLRNRLGIDITGIEIAEGKIEAGNVTQPTLTSDSFHAKALNVFIKKYATKQNLLKATAMLTLDGTNWNFSAMELKPYAAAANMQTPEAKQTYSLLSPLELNTFGASLEKGKIKVTQLTNSVFYAKADSQTDPQSIEDVKNKLQNSTFKEVERTDKDLRRTLELPSESGESLDTSLAKLSNPSQTNSTTTSCQSCHSLARIGLDKGKAIYAQESWNMMLINPEFTSARTAREVANETLRANAEGFGVKLDAACTVNKVVSCLEFGGGAACLESSRCK